MRRLAGFYDRLVGPSFSPKLPKKFASRIAYLFSRKRNLHSANRRENLYSGLLSLAPCSCVATRHVANYRSDVTGNALQRAISRWPARTTKYASKEYGKSQADRRSATSRASGLYLLLLISLSTRLIARVPPHVCDVSRSAFVSRRRRRARLPRFVRFSLGMIASDRDDGYSRASSSKPGLAAFIHVYRRRGNLRKYPHLITYCQNCQLPRRGSSER